MSSWLPWRCTLINTGTWSRAPRDNVPFSIGCVVHEQRYRTPWRVDRRVPTCFARLARLALPDKKGAFALCCNIHGSRSGMRGPSRPGLECTLRLKEVAPVDDRREEAHRASLSSRSASSGVRKAFVTSHNTKAGALEVNVDWRSISERCNQAMSPYFGSRHDGPTISARACSVQRQDHRKCPIGANEMIQQQVEKRSRCCDLPRSRW